MVEDGRGPSKENNVAKKKSLDFYHGGKSQTIKFYETASPAMIMNFAKERLGIKQHLKIMLTD